jgi:hydrogenase-4 component E
MTMTAETYRQLLGLVVGVMIVAAVLALWRRSLTAIVRILAVQGLAVAAIALLVGIEHHEVTDFVVSGLFVVVKVVVIPIVLLRVVHDATDQRESEPIVNVATTIVGAAILTILAFAATRGLVGLHPSPEADALPAGFAVVLIAFFGLVVRRNAVVQVVGFLMLENGIAVVALLAAAGISLTVELAVALDLLLAVLVLQILTTRMQAKYGGLELDHLSELAD